MRAPRLNPVSFVSSAVPRLLLAPMEGMLDARLREVITRLGRYDWCVSEFVRVPNAVLPNRSFRRAAPEVARALPAPGDAVAFDEGPINANIAAWNERFNREIAN